MSCHICNDWAHALARGDGEVFERVGSILDRFPRVQLNFSASLVSGKFDGEKLISILAKRNDKGQEFVFQLPSCEPLKLLATAHCARMSLLQF